MISIHQKLYFYPLGVFFLMVGNVSATSRANRRTVEQLNSYYFAIPKISKLNSGYIYNYNYIYN